MLGLVLGQGLARTLGHPARWMRAALLIATGLNHSFSHSATNSTGSTDTAGHGLAGLLISGLGLSIDNLAVGFALGTYQVFLKLGITSRAALRDALADLPRANRTDPPNPAAAAACPAAAPAGSRYTGSPWPGRSGQAR